MKQTIYFTLILFLSIYGRLYAQCINGSKTDPANPINIDFLPWANINIPGGPFTHNPFLNTFNWANPYSPVYIEQQAGFNIGNISWINGQFPMLSPFNTGLVSSSAYNQKFLTPSVADRDYKIKDGWELLYINTGKTPDGIPLFAVIPNSPLPNPQAASPVNVPYMVLYNKYRGMMRLFANVWFDVAGGQRFNEIRISLRFEDDRVNGMLRHTGSYDLPLDQKTKHRVIRGPSAHPVNADQWLMADFQIGFDPCICNRNEGKLQFEFTTINTIDLQMVSRSISIDQKVTNSNFLMEDFLNLDDVEIGVDKPGARIYKEMGAMVDAYNRALTEYETNLTNYNSPDDVLKRSLLLAAKTGLGSVGGIVGTGIAGSVISNKPLRDFVIKMKPRVSLWSDDLINLDTNDANNFAKSVVEGVKGTIGKSFDFLNTIIEVPGKPLKPAPPVATLTETVYKGQLTQNNRQLSNALIIPGALPNAHNGGNPGLNRLNYPAYNEVLGLFAVLETPKISTRLEAIDKVATLSKSGYHRYVNHLNNSKANVQIKFKEPLKYKLNHAVDFNFGKTKIYYSFRITLSNQMHNTSPKINTSGNFGVSAWVNGTKDIDASVLENQTYSYESYSINNKDITIVNTPFIDSKNMLNEPVSFTFSVNSFLSLQADIYNIIPDQDLPQILELDIDKFLRIEKIEVKVMADMYFESLGSINQDINTVQVFTYDLYNFEQGNDQYPEQASTLGNIEFLSLNENMLNHIPGTTTLQNIHFIPTTLNNFDHSFQIGNDLFLRLENCKLMENVTVENGYKLHIQFLGSTLVGPEAEVNPEIVIEPINSQLVYGNPLVFEVAESDLTLFCDASSNKYMANMPQSLNKTIANIIDTSNSALLNIKAYPNPSSNELNVVIDNENESITQIEIFDAIGNSVIKIESQENSIHKLENACLVNTRNLKDGIYIIRVRSSNGRIGSAKILIQN